MHYCKVAAPTDIIMVRPHHFRINDQTQVDNHFQAKQYGMSQIHKSAYQEITNAAQTLSQNGINVHLFEDEGVITPDSVFPNNWLSTHQFGKLAVFPMMAPNRRLERRDDIINMLKQKYHVTQLIDYTPNEQDQKYLEGTGAMVIDHANKAIFAVRSKRCHEDLFEQFCRQLNYEPILFDAKDHLGNAVYHTNVLMCIAENFSMIALDMIKNNVMRDFVEAKLRQNGRALINLTEDQIHNFAGNALELKGKDGNLLIMSQSAYDSLDEGQICMIEHHNKIVPIDMKTIELAGGSIRCAMAGLHLTRR